MENKINNLNYLAFQPTFISSNLIQLPFGGELFSNKAGSSNGPIQYSDRVLLNGMTSNSNYDLSILPPISNTFTYGRFDSINLNSVDSMSTIAEGVKNSQRDWVSNSVQWISNEAAIDDRCYDLENMRKNFTAVLYNELPKKVPCTTVDNRNIGIVNIHNISTVDKGKGLQKSTMLKGQWAKEENEKLEKLVEIHGDRKWSKLARSMIGRTGKQCRERWHNHVKANIKKMNWTEEEDRALVEGHMRYSNRWVEIAKQIPGRTENSVKNRWNNVMRREIPRAQSSRKTKQQKYSKVLRDYVRMVLAKLYEAQASSSNIPNGYDMIALPNEAVGSHEVLSPNLHGYPYESYAHMFAFGDGMNPEDAMHPHEASLSQHCVAHASTSNISNGYDMIATPNEAVGTHEALSPESHGMNFEDFAQLTAFLDDMSLVEAMQVDDATLGEHFAGLLGH